MLVLTRNAGQSVIVGDNIKITVITTQGGQVRLGIEAPKEMAVDREEIYLRKQAEKGKGEPNLKRVAGADWGNQR